MKVVHRSLRSIPNGYYIFYVNREHHKWMFIIEASEHCIYILKTYHTGPYHPSGKRTVEIMFKNEKRDRMTLKAGDPNGILFEIDEGKFMLEMAEDL